MVDFCRIICRPLHTFSEWAPDFCPIKLWIFSLFFLFLFFSWPQTAFRVGRVWHSCNLRVSAASLAKKKDSAYGEAIEAQYSINTGGYENCSRAVQDGIYMPSKSALTPSLRIRFLPRCFWNSSNVWIDDGGTFKENRRVPPSLATDCYKSSNYTSIPPSPRP